MTVISTNRIIFNKTYSFSATLTNPSAKFLKSITDQFSFMVKPPETNDKPITCMNFTLVFRNKNFPIYYPGNKSQIDILFDNNNYTDIIFTGQSPNVTNCILQYNTSTLGAMSFIQFDNPSLFDDQRSYVFNVSQVTIPKTKIQAGLTLTQNQSLSSYAYLFNSMTKEILGFEYVKLTLRVSDQSLYAKIPLSFIQVDKDRLLYIDGGSSYDLKASDAQFNYTWSVEGFPSITLPNSKILTLNPEQRTALGINQPGKYYNFTLIVQVDSRQSLPAKVLVQIAPGLDPNNCITVSLKSIDIQKIITYTDWPLLLQAKVTRGTCTDLTIGSLVWQSQDVSWQFWQYFGNNNTVAMDPDDLRRLPKSKDIRMQVIQYYKIKDIEYLSILNFVLFVERPDLVAILSYPQVFNPREKTALILDSFASYDPQAVQANTTDVAIKCQWDCPVAFNEICFNANVLRTNNGCILSIPSQNILTSASYNFTIAGQMYLFKNTITKDSRTTTTNVYVTIVDSNYYPKCSITVQKPYQNSINQFEYLNANCNSTVSSSPSRFSYLWSLYQFDTLQYIPEAQYMTTDQPTLRIPPYVLGGYKEIFVQLMVTADNIYTTPIGLYYRANDQSYFTKGNLNINFNVFTAYLANFIMTPSGWDSALSSQLNFQYRIRETQNSYRVLISPQEASSTSPISNMILPPFSYESVIYIDIIDTLGNFITVKQPLISKVDIQMTATQFAIRINNITQTISYTFNEIQLEQTTYRLRLLFEACMNDNINTEGQPIAFFRILAESAIQYLHNTFVLDKRLNSVLQNERKTIINQHIIEIIYSMTVKFRNTIQTGQLIQALNLINQVVTSGNNYTMGNSVGDITAKLYLITFNTFDGNNNLFLNNSFGFPTTQSLFDSILLKVLTNLQSFLFLGEKVQSTFNGFSFQAIELQQSISSMLDTQGFSYDKNEVFGVFSSIQNGMMILVKNDTFAYVQVYDKNLNQLGVSKLSKAVSITFKMTDSIRQRYINGTIALQCASRDGFTQAWTSSRITLGTINNATGEITCLANHFTQYTVFMIDRVPPPPPPPVGPIIDPTKIITNPNETDITGKWNKSLGGATYMDGQPLVPLIFEQNSTTMYLVSLGCLLLFIFTHYFFRIKYKAEHNEQPQIQFKHQFIYKKGESRCRNYFRLYGLILLNFNPYLNIFAIYNKFLPRWTRNLMLQIYFMTVSVGFGVNQTLISYGYSNFDLIPLFFIITGIVLLLRPLGIKIIYSQLYEPYSRIEHYHQTTVEENRQQEQPFREPQVIGQEENQIGRMKTAIDKKESAGIMFKEDWENQFNDKEDRVEDPQNFDGSAKKNKSERTSMKKQVDDQWNVNLGKKESIEVGFQPAKPKSFLPSIFAPSSIPFPDEQAFSSKLPSIGGKRGQEMKQMINAFDEIDLEKDNIPNQFSANNSNTGINAKEGKLDRSQDDDRGLEDIHIKPQRFGIQDDEIKKPKLKGKKKKGAAERQKQVEQFLAMNPKKVEVEKEPEPLKLNSGRLPDIFAGRGAVFKESGMRISLDQRNKDLKNTEATVTEQRKSMDLNKSGTAKRQNSNASGGNAGAFLQFYQGQNQDKDEADEDDEDMNPVQYEGGDKEESKKQGGGIAVLNEGTIDRVESVGNDNLNLSHNKYDRNPADSPMTDLMGGLEQNPSQSGERFLDQDQQMMGPPHHVKQKSSYGDNIVEHTMNQTNCSSDSIMPRENREKSRYLSKIFGKAFIFIIWCGLIVANMMCLTRMGSDQFRDWAILSCAAFVALVLIIDTMILYPILGCLMLKPLSQVREDSLSLKRAERNGPTGNENNVEYYSRGGYCCRFGHSNSQHRDAKKRREKMKDLRRRLNPLSPL